MVRGPALLLLFLGSTVSFLASGQPSLRLIADGAISFAFVPVCELAGLAVALRAGTRRVPLTRAIDRFFVGNAPWLLWSVMLSAASTLSRPVLWRPLTLLLSAIAPAIWSVVIDYHFFRQVTAAESRTAVRGVLIQRGVAWSLATAYFLGIAIWPQVLGRLR